MNVFKLNLTQSLLFLARGTAAPDPTTITLFDVRNLSKPFHDIIPKVEYLKETTKLRDAIHRVFMSDLLSSILI